MADNNSRELSIIMNAFDVVADGGTNEALANARVNIENARASQSYLNALITILKNQAPAQEKRKILAAIEIKNHFLKNKNLIGADVLKELIFLYFNEPSFSVLAHLSIGIAAALTLSKEFTIDALKVIQSKTKESAPMANRLFNLLKDILDLIYGQKFENKVFENCSIVSETLLADLLWFWEICVRRFIGDLNDNENNQILYNLTKIIFYTLCFDLKPAALLNSKQSENFLAKIIQFLIKISQNPSFLSDESGLLSNVFVSNIDIVFTMVSRFPLESLRFLPPFLELAFEIFSFPQTPPENISLSLLKFLCAVLNCREYRPSHKAAILTIKSGLTDKQLAEGQTRLAAFFRAERTKPFVEQLLRKFVQFSAEEIGDWKDDGEAFYAEQFLVPYVNCRSEALRIVKAFCALFPAEMAGFSVELMEQAGGFWNKNDILLTENVKCAIYLIFAVCYKELTTAFEEKGFSAQKWFDLFKIDLNRFEGNHDFLIKTAFCRSLQNMFEDYSNSRAFSQISGEIIPALFSLFQDRNVVVRMSAEYCIRKIIESVPSDPFFKDNSEKLIERYISLYTSLKQTNTKLKVLSSLTEIVRVLGPKLKRAAQTILQSLVAAWTDTFSTQAQNDCSMLFLEFLDGFILLTDLFPNEFELFNPFFVTLLGFCTDTKGPNTYLNQRGFMLFQLYLENVSHTCKELDLIFQNAFEYFARGVEIKTAYGIIEQYLLLDQKNFFSTYKTPVQKLMEMHLKSVNFSQTYAVLKCLNLMIRAAQTKWAELLEPSLLALVLAKIFENFNTANSFSVVCTGVDAICILIFYNFSAAKEVLFRNGENHLYTFIKSVIDTFDRIPAINIKKDVILAVSSCFETTDFKVLMTAIEPVLKFAVEVINCEKEDGKMDVGALENNRDYLSKSDKRNIAFLDVEPINKVNVKNFVSEKLKLCAAINGDKISVVFGMLKQRVKTEFESCE